MLVVTQAAEPTLATAVLVAVAVAAVLLLAGFVVVERRSADPLLPFRALPEPDGARVPTWPRSPCSPPPSGVHVAILYLQDVLRYGPLVSGLALLPGAVLSVVVSRWVAPACVNRFGLRVAGVTGLLLVAAGFALLLRLGPETGYGTGLLPAVVVCFGLGMGIAYRSSPSRRCPEWTMNRRGWRLVSSRPRCRWVGVGAGAGEWGGRGRPRLRAGPATVQALRWPPRAGTALPLLGAVITAIGLRGAGAD